MKPKKELSNHEIVTLAVYLVGGESQYVDTEDVAVKANELAPGRFAWRKYKNQINIENVRAFLSDSKKEKNGAYTLGSGKKGWILTEAGLAFVKQHIGNINDANLAKQNISSKEKKWRLAERNRLLASDAFAKLQAEGIEAVTKREAESFFRVDDYVATEARKQKILRLKNVFGSDPLLGEAISLLAEKLEEMQND